MKLTPDHPARIEPYQVRTWATIPARIDAAPSMAPVLVECYDIEGPFYIRAKLLRVIRKQSRDPRAIVEIESDLKTVMLSRVRLILAKTLPPLCDN